MGKQQIVTSEKLEPWNFCIKNDLNDESGIKIIKIFQESTIQLIDQSFQL